MKKIVLLLAIVFLVGCGTTGSVVKESAYVYNKVSSGEVVENVKKADLSIAEEEILTHALNAVTNFRIKYGRIMADPSMLISINKSEFQEDYERIRTNFIRVEKIVVDNWHEYDNQTKDTFLDYRKHAYNLDRNAAKMVTSFQYRDAIRDTLIYGFAGLKLIASLKP